MSGLWCLIASVPTACAVAVLQTHFEHFHKQYLRIMRLYSIQYLIWIHNQVMSTITYRLHESEHI